MYDLDLMWRGMDDVGFLSFYKITVYDFGKINRCYFNF